MEIYAIGCDQLSFRHANSLLEHNNFKNVVLTDSIKYSKYFNVNSPMAISIDNFVLESIKKKSLTLVSFYDFHVGKQFIDYLKDKLKNITIIDWYSFALNHNLPILYVPAKEEREKFLANKEKYEILKEILTDDLSKRTIDVLTEAYISKDRSLINSVYIDSEMEFCNRISNNLSIKPDGDEIFVDIGAWDGDTVIKFIDIVNGSYRAIHAFEPIKSEYKKLSSKRKYIKNLHTYNFVLSNETGEVEFNENMGMRSSINTFNEEKTTSTNIRSSKLDDILKECTFVKIDVEGHESKVIKGMKRLIQNFKPKLSVDIHHYPDDIFNVVDEILKIHKYKNITLRQHFPDFHGGVMYFFD